MNTPITKRIHMNASKKNSVAKQTEFVTNAAGEVLKGMADITKGEKAKDQPAGSPEFNEAFGAARKAGQKEFEFKGKKYNTNLAEKGKDTPGSAKFNYDPVLTDPTKGTTVDTSDVYGVYRIGQGQKKAAKDVRRASIKLGKYVDFDYNLDGSINMESVKPKEGLSKNARKMAKFNERMYELKSMDNTRKRIGAMSEAGVDPRRTARFEIGTKMKEGTPGGEPVIDTSGKYQTQEEFENKAKKAAGINLGTVDSAAGSMPEGDALNDILRKNIDEKENARVTTPVSTAVSNVMSDVVSRGFSTSSGLTKKYNAPTSMLKKSGMKMGGFGSKTYKK